MTGASTEPLEQKAPHRLEQAARTNRQLLSRSSLTLVSRAFAKFGQILFLIVAARMLSVDEFASYSYIIVLASAFTILSDTGVPLVASRDASAGRASVDDLFHSALPVVLVSAAIAGLILPVFGAVDSGPGSTVVPVALAALYVLLNRVFDFVATLLRGIGRFGLEAALQAGGSAVFIAGAIATTAAGYGVTAVLAVLCVKELASAVIAYVAIRGDIRASRGPKRTSWRRLLGVGIRLALAGIALALITRIPLALLGNTGTTDEVALFSAAQRFGDAAYLLAISGGFALLPGIAFLAHSDPDRARALVRRVLLAVTAVAALLAAAGMLLAEPLVRLVFGSDFAGSDDLVRIVLLGMPAYAVLGITWYAVVAFDGERRLLAVGLLGLLVCAVLSAFLVPAVGANGAAWTYIGSFYATAALSLAVLVSQYARVPVTGAIPGRAVG
jgi:O-antigen/teichoic acid export membrane protein